MNYSSGISKPLAVSYMVLNEEKNYVKYIYGSNKNEDRYDGDIYNSNIGIPLSMM